MGEGRGQCERARIHAQSQRPACRYLSPKPRKRGACVRTPFLPKEKKNEYCPAPRPARSVKIAPSRTPAPPALPRTPRPAHRSSGCHPCQRALPPPMLPLDWLRVFLCKPPPLLGILHEAEKFFRDAPALIQPIPPFATLFHLRSFRSCAPSSCMPCTKSPFDFFFLQVRAPFEIG